MPWGEEGVPGNAGAPGRAPLWPETGPELGEAGRHGRAAARALSPVFPPGGKPHSQAVHTARLRHSERGVWHCCSRHLKSQGLAASLIET